MLLVKVYLKSTLLDQFLLPFGERYDFSTVVGRCETFGYDPYSVRCVVKPLKVYDRDKGIPSLNL